ncbi:MAG: SDR family oxidoreductase [Porticoccaceae bacterium]|jgi:NAD(P)-dependent dehydrogenase (short-subunit alcohol dehydrogenase family)|nr:SDR family oxidoreductase [Porticoccaceae bacterium]MDG1448006.1 SDR family oxidoreductase [Porticoccaceae bacterium]
MAGRLEGKVIVILGASDERSMGAATARRCQAEGAKLVLAARRLDRVQAIADSLGAVAIGCDITDEQQLAALADAAVTHYGKLDGAINFAGIETSSAIADISREVLQQNCEVHLIGTTLFIKHMAARMSDGGSVVTTSSQTALLAPPGLAAYAGTKAGADHIVRIAAVEYGGQNIRVNSLSPGFTPSAMTEGFLAMPSIRQAFLNEIPMGKLPSTEDMANAALWLLSDESFMTGRMLDISGGQTLRRVPTATEMGF